MKSHWTLEEALEALEKLNPNTKAEWGSMSAQKMVEHLSDFFRVASAKTPQKLLIPEEKLESMQRFLYSEKPMNKNIKVDFLAPELSLRHDNLELAIDEFAEEWVDWELYFDEKPNITSTHPYYGDLNLEKWQRLNAKHLNHHFEQFGLYSPS